MYIIFCDAAWLRKMVSMWAMKTNVGILPAGTTGIQPALWKKCLKYQLWHLHWRISVNFLFSLHC